MKFKGGGQQIFFIMSDSKDKTGIGYVVLS